MQHNALMVLSDWRSSIKLILILGEEKCVYQVKKQH